VGGSPPGRKNRIVTDFKQLLMWKVSESSGDFIFATGPMFFPTRDKVTLGNSAPVICLAEIQPLLINV